MNNRDSQIVPTIFSNRNLANIPNISSDINGILGKRKSFDLLGYAPSAQTNFQKLQDTP